MDTLNPGRSEEVFADFKAAYTTAQAKVEASRCLYCYDAPCITACPTGIDIPEFIRKISTDNVKGSAATIFDSNILGMSCARVCPVESLCVGDCVHNLQGVPPIQIGKLQRYATDAAYDNDWRFFEAGSDTGKSIGLIGAGPASLACAHRLRMHGHRVTLYERRQVIGGLNTFGVAPYKMNAQRSIDEVEWVLSIGGIEVQTGVQIPNDVSWDELRSRHDALFLGFGLGPDSALRGTDGAIEGVYGAVEWIEQMKLATVDLTAVKHAVVVGGGNTALDVVRELLGLGLKRVTMVYRGTQAKMSGYAHEWEAAKVEGAQAAWQTQPTAALTQDGKVTGLTCYRLDADKKPVPESEHTIHADLVLVAIGQSKLGDLAEALPGVETQWGRVVVDSEQATGCAGVFAGGDCANGGKEVVNGVAEGRDAAEAIHRFLSQGAE